MQRAVCSGCLQRLLRLFAAAVYSGPLRLFAAAVCSGLFAAGCSQRPLRLFAAAVSPESRPDSMHSSKQIGDEPDSETKKAARRILDRLTSACCSVLTLV